ncbi:MAG: DUF1232 domain-containing protein [Leptolyngbya sp. SIO4C1]|nr:DUF1232 domain-containing protein [Leptolyngbya sp. SIO4C1]
MKNLVESFYDWYRQTLRHPKYRWLIIAGTLLYLVSPIDISPDFLPIVGWIDDGLLATLLIAELSQLATDLLANRRQRPNAEANTADEPVIDVQAR